MLGPNFPPWLLCGRLLAISPPSDAAFMEQSIRNRRTTVKKLIATMAALAFCSSAALADPSCQDQATAKKLAGAALNSFMTKCEKDATAVCQKTSADKKYT